MAVTNAEINSWLSDNPGASDATIASAMQKFGVSPGQVSRATGTNPTEVQTRFNAAIAPPPAAPTGLINTNPKVPNTQTYFGAGNPNISSADIRHVLNQPGMTDAQIAAEAAKYNVSLGQIQNAAPDNPRFSSANTTKWLSEQGITQDADQPEDSTPSYDTVQDSLDTTNADTVNAETTDSKLSLRDQILAEVFQGGDQGQAGNTAQYVRADQSQTKGTVSAQLDSLLNQNNSHMRQAETYGFQHANSRGLLNSSLAGQAAQNAMIERALQIATPDAAASNQFSMFNADNANTTNRFNADQNLKSSMFDADQANRIGMFNADIERQYDLTKLGITKDIAINAENIARDYGLASMDTESKLKIANINAASKSSTDGAGLNDRLLASIAEINGRDISQEAKDDQIKVMVNATDGAISMLGAFDAMGAALNPNASTSDRAGILAPNSGSAVNNGIDAGEPNPNTGLGSPIKTNSGYNLSGSELALAEKIVAANPGSDINRVVTKKEIEDIRNSPIGAIAVERKLGNFEKLYTPGTTKGNSFILMHPKA